jgi:hypothetical protein
MALFTKTSDCRVTVETNEGGFEFQIFSCIRKMKCKGANQTLVVQKISSLKKEREALFQLYDWVLLLQHESAF